MKVQVSGAADIQVNDQVFSCDFNEGLIHQVITSYMAGGRQGSKAQKSRSDVRGGGAKPWRQKGTGRARAGTSSSPIWRSGGVTFAAKPRSYKQKVNKKMYRKALMSILSELLRQGRLMVVDNLTLETPKTKQLVSYLKTSLGIDQGSVMLVTLDQDNNLMLASRNLFYVDVFSVDQVDPVSLVGFDKVVITVGAIKSLEEKLA